MVHIGLPEQAGMHVLGLAVENKSSDSAPRTWQAFASTMDAH